MGYHCPKCQRTYATRSGFTRHLKRVHSRKTAQRLPSTFAYHPHLTGLPCDVNGEYLPAGSPPPPLDTTIDWSSFETRVRFELAEHLFEKVEMSAGDISDLLRIWAADKVEHDSLAPFQDAAELYAAIDSIQHGEASWYSFKVKYNGALSADSPPWHRQEYVVHARDVRSALHHMISNPEFAGAFDYRPYKEYVGPQKRRWSNFMSGTWSWKQADEISNDPTTHGAFFCPVVLGADKTTVSVATGHTEFHPVYMSCGNLHNGVRRAHREGVVPIAFLSIPKTTREYDDTDEFRAFRKHIYHASLTHILEPLRAGMTVPEIVRCADQHLRRCIYGLGPFIADYPEQVLLACIVQGWCPKCFARPDQLENIDEPRFQELTEHLLGHFRDNVLWNSFGIDATVQPYTWSFPRADIHELLSPDILHQVVKGTFKDHLVSWIEQYLYIKYSTAEAKRRMDELDRRIAAAPSFPGLRRFPEGRNFKQWTGNDSKALMKVFLPAISGLVPSKYGKPDTQAYLIRSKYYIWQMIRSFPQPLPASVSSNY